VKDWFEGIRDTATPDRLRPAGNRTGRKKKLFWAGMSGDGEKNNWFGQKHPPTRGFYASPSLPPPSTPTDGSSVRGMVGPI